MIDATDQRKNFDINIKLSIGDYNKSVLRNNDIDPANPYKDFMKYSSDEEDEHDLEDTIEFISFPGEKNYDGNIDTDHSRYNEELSKEIKDNLIGTSVLLPTGRIILEGVIRSRKSTVDGKQLQGKENKNHILDTRTYNVEFPDDGTAKYSTKSIIESLFDNSNENGERMVLISGIIIHRNIDDAIPSNQSNTEVNGNTKRVITTKGLDIQVE